MAQTIRTTPNPTSLITAGDAVLTASKRAKTKPIAGDLSAFAKVHAEYKAAEADVRDAEAAKRAQEQVVADADVAQDRAVAQLGVDLASDGLPRGNPFGGLQSKKPFPTPSAVQVLGYAAEAKVVHAIVKAVKKKKGLSKRSLESAAAADKTATAVETALKPMAGLTETLLGAVGEREALTQGWATSFSTLKAGARYVDKRDKTDLYKTLFQSAPKAKAKAKPKAKAAKPPATTQPPETPTK